MEVLFSSLFPSSLPLRAFMKRCHYRPTATGAGWPGGEMIGRAGTMWAPGAHMHGEATRAVL